MANKDENKTIVDELTYFDEAAWNNLVERLAKRKADRDTPKTFSWAINPPNEYPKPTIKK